MANGSLSSNTSGEGEIRKRLIQEGLVDCIIALPAQLFYTTQIPACLWFVSRDRHNHKFRDRRKEILFIDTRKLGKMVTRKNRELTKEEIDKIANTYHSWRNKKSKYKDIKGFCKSANITEIEKHDFVLTPGRHVGFEVIEEDDEVFEEKMKRLTKELAGQFEESKTMEFRIRKNLKGLCYDI